MMDFLRALFSNLKALFSGDGFMPHGHCYLWRPGVLWLHITSDALITLAYYSIPFTLLYFIRKRRDIPFNGMFLCFAVFIVACGTTHLMEIWVIWYPAYWVSGTVKAITALASVPTAILLVKLVPRALALPSPAILRATNEDLAREVVERKRAEADVRRLNEELERRVLERTQQLENANESLRREINERQRAEQTSRENQQLLQAIIDNSTTVIYVKDLQGRYLLVNRRFLDLFHHNPKTVLGQTDYDLFPHAIAEAFRGMDARVAAANHALTEEEVVSQEDGLHTYVSVKSPLWDEQGKAYAVFGVSMDITAHKQEEEKTKWLASFPELNPNPIVELDVATGTIHYQNPFATKLFPDLKERRLEHPYLATISRATSNWRHGQTEPVQTEVSVGGNHYAQTISYVPASRRVRVYGSDITDRRRIYIALQESEQRFRTMANSIPQLTWIARADGFITWYNDRWYAYTGTKPGEMEGWGWQKIHDPVRLPEVMAQWSESIMLGQPFEMEFPLRGADDKFRRFLTRALPLRNSDGVVEQWFGTNTDVEELKRAGEEIKVLNAELETRVAERTAELEAANKELEAFSYSVSHDLRAPLRAVNGFAGIVLSEYSQHLPEEGQQYLERVRKGGQRMGELIDDLLAFSRLSRQALARQTVDTNRLVQETLAELKPALAGRSLEIKVGDLPPCQGDQALLKQVWINLLSNALKYSRDRSPAIVEAGYEQRESYGVYFVRDNGVGFDMQYASKLFGVFQRLHRAEEFEGTGVGLAIVQRIINRHGGRVWATAEPNRGATFYFTLEEKS